MPASSNHLTKSNQISIIIAKKGSGKSYFACALMLAQDKKPFWITPLVNGAIKLPCDSDNFVSNTPYHLSTTHILANRDDIDAHIEKVQRISENIGGAYLVIDELDYFASSRLYHQSKIFEIINYGRHLNLDIVFIARRLQDIPKSVVTNADFFYLGKHNDIKNDVKYYLDFMNEATIEASKNLEVGQFICYDVQKNKSHLLELSLENLQRIDNVKIC